jgi:hypothetical protein
MTDKTPTPRPEFERAWELMAPRVLEVMADEGVDDAAVSATLLRFAAQLHIRALSKDHSVDATRDVFLRGAAGSFDQTIADIERLARCQ